MVGLAVVLTFMATFLLVLVLLSLGEGPLQSPMRRLRRQLTAKSEATAAVRVFRDDTLSTVPVLDQWLSRATLARRLKRYLEQADISLRVGVVLGIALVLAVLGGRLAWHLTFSPLWWALGLSASGSVPFLYIQHRRRLRLRRYAEQLPNALDVLNRSLQAGHSLLQGLHFAAQEMPEPASKEFRMTFEELRLGRSLREALQIHADRVENLDFNLFATALLIQREAGGNLTEILENASGTIRERYKLMGLIQALTSQTRLASKVVAALPFGIGSTIYLLKPDLIMILFKEETGRTLLAFALMLQVAGFFVMKWITTIKV